MLCPILNAEIDNQKFRFKFQKVVPFPISASTICSGKGLAQISGCQGDSGGPYVRHNGQYWELHGAVSWGSINCSEKPNEYSVYSNIFNLKGWIEENIKED